MRSSIVKSMVPVLLLAVGVIALVYANSGRVVPVWSVVMVEVEEVIFERPPQPWDGPQDPAGRRPGPPLPPRPRKVKTSKPQDEEQLHGEPAIIRNVTVGGIARLADGRLKLTYGPGEDGPALCPT